MDTVIKVKCIDQTLIITNSPVIASGGLNENKLECSFCEKWDGFAKTAIFYQDKNNVYYSLLDEDDTCTIPKEATINKGTMFFGIFGTKGDVTRTSEVLRYKIVDGAITEDIKPSDPTPDIYEQIVSRINKIENETIPSSIATHNTSSSAHLDIRDDIDIIESKIPSQATSTNQLADKDFVNSSIATNTAYFKGTFNIVDDLKLSRTATHEQVATAIANKVTDATNNDYSFVAIPNETITTEIDQYDRYKFNGTSWAYEFTLNNSSFTASQWDAINSGISSNDVSQITTNKSSITNLQNNKQDKLVSGTNIKTINGVSLLGEGDMETPLPIANANTLGGVKIGDGINVTDDGTISAQEYSLPTASDSVKGGVKIGSGLSMNGEVLNNAYIYNLPTASSSTLGGVKVGSNLSISNGVLSASGVFYSIDTSNLILQQSLADSVTGTKTNFSYTATQDCWFVLDLMENENGASKVYIDDVLIYYHFTINRTEIVTYYPLKKGQTIKNVQNNSTYGGWAESNYRVYGLKGGK